MKRIPIGQFSRMTRLSVKALRHYEKQDLLAPAYVDPATRYRYYELSQLREASSIRVLRSLDMPIAEIKKILSAGGTGLVGELLNAHKDRLSAQVAAQQRTLAYLQSVINRKEIVVQYSIETTNTEEQYVACVRRRTSLSAVQQDIQAGFGTLVTGLMQAQVAPNGAPFIVYHDSLEGEDEGDIEVCAPVPDTFKGSDEVTVQTLNPRAVATTLHKGPYEQVGPAYEAIVTWMVENGLEVAGPPREIYLNDPQTTAPDELLTRIEFPTQSPAR